MAVEIEVSDVVPASGRLLPAGLGPSLKARGIGRFEAASANSRGLVVDRKGRLPTHGLLAAVHAAFDRHHPLVLSPDDVWLCIAQGLANHVRLHAEALRSRLVPHEGTALIRVIRDELVRGSPHNDWQGVFAELSDRIAEQVGARRDMFVADFSTTGPVERAASQVVMFDALSPYFDYRVETLCGIPRITLLGTPDDWRSIRTRAELLYELDLSPWAEALLPVLDEIIRSAEGIERRTFWQSLYKHHEISGGPHVTGWINVLFPYVGHDPASLRRNASLERWQEDIEEPWTAAATSDFPSGLSSVPFVWEYHGTEIPMTFVAGFVGLSQEVTRGAVRPAIGWAIREAGGTDAR